MRVRHRYLVVRKDKNSLKKILKGLNEEFPNLKIIEIKKSKELSIVRCAHLQLRPLRERLCALGVATVGTSGTVKRAVTKFVRKG